MSNSAFASCWLFQSLMAATLTMLSALGAGNVVAQPLDTRTSIPLAGSVSAKEPTIYLEVDGNPAYKLESCATHWSITDSSSGRVLHKLPAWDVQPLAAAISGDGKVFSVGEGMGHFRVWRLDEKPVEIARFRHLSGIVRLQLSANGSQIAVRSVRGLVVRSVADRTQSWLVPIAPPAAFQLSEDGRWLKTDRIYWNVAQRQQVSKPVGNAIFRQVRALADTASLKGLTLPHQPWQSEGEIAKTQRQIAIAAALANRTMPTSTPPVKSNKLGMQLALLPRGQFVMGAPVGERGRGADEEQQIVAITREFLLGVHEVTQAEFARVVGHNPSEHSHRVNETVAVVGQDHGKLPVENVTWFDCIEFCNKLSRLEGLSPYYELVSIERLGDHYRELIEEHYGKQDDDSALLDSLPRNSRSIRVAQVTIAGGNGYRLPTEAEWEYACRAGTATPHAIEKQLFTHANLRGTNVRHPQPVGSYASNAFGLHEMHGNVWEWCFDSYTAQRTGLYANDPCSDGSSNNMRTLRGGGFNSNAQNSRAANRGSLSPWIADASTGFRVARTVNVD